MAVVLTVPQALYTPRTLNANFTMPVGATLLIARLTCTGWPIGEVGSLALTQPDGSAGGGATFHGGVLGKDGLPLTSVSFSLQSLGGILAPGQWGIQIVIQQTLTTAITVERF